MDIFRKNKLSDMVEIKSIVSVWRITLSGTGKPIPDIHDFWEFIYVEEGTFSVLVDGKLFVFGCGESFLYPPLALHIGARPEKCTLRIISFESNSEALSRIAGRVLKLSPRVKELFMLANEIGLKSFFYPENTGMRGMMLNSEVNVYDIQKMKKSFELMLIELLSLSEKNESTGKNTENYKKELYAAMNEFLRHNIGKNLSVGEIAEGLSVSVSKLKKISAEAFGASPISYFTDLKIDAAKRMIRESSLNFTEISERLGLSSIHYFSRLFKKRTGMTPSEYAKSV